MYSLMVSQLRNIYELYKAKDQQLDFLVGNLQTFDVQNDQIYDVTLARIRGQILLNEVTFGPLAITSNRQEQKTVPPNYNNLFGGQEIVQIVTVEYKFKGSSELFKYIPNGWQYSSNDTTVYQPEGTDQICLEVEVPRLDKAEVISKADIMMKTTLSIITQINPQIRNWSDGKEIAIKMSLDQKRKELMALYS
jgi:hypothetical protein